MRHTQIIGLTAEAENFLEKNCKIESKIKRCSNCNFPYEVIYKKVQKVYDASGSSGMYGDGPDLHEYELKDGSKIREIVQAAPWSSGPCIFLCLEDDKNKRFCEWTEEEINNC